MVAVALALAGVFAFPYHHSDDWNYLAYIVEINSPDRHMLDPYMGTDVDPFPRYRVNLPIWTFAIVSELFSIDPVELFHSVAPPILAIVSLVGVFFMLRAAGFSPALSAVGAVIWVAYFFSAFWATRLHGRYFFVRLSQDKVITWLIVGPPTLAALIAFARHVEAFRQASSSALQGVSGWADRLATGFRNLPGSAWLALFLFATFSLLSALIHPLGAVFSVVFVAATILCSAWARRWLPSSQLVVGAGLALLPALAWGGVLRLVMSTGYVDFEFGGRQSRSTADLSFWGFELDETSRPIRFSDIGGFTIADPALIALLTFPALIWIAYSFWKGRRTVPLGIAAALFLLSAPVFIPVLPDIIARVGGTPAVVRLVWLHPFAAVLALTDFANFVSVGGWTRERLYTLACGAVVGGALAVLAIVNLVDRSPAIDEFEPTDAELQILDAVDQASGDATDRVVVLADENFSTYIPSYVENANPVFFRRFGSLPEADRDGQSRLTAARALLQAESFDEVVQLMDFWDADLVVLPRDAPLFSATTPPDLIECVANAEARLLALSDVESDACPPQA